MDENLKAREQLEAKLTEMLKDADPEVIAKYGNPLDKEDPRNWLPSKRAEEGLSTEEQLRLLGLDYETLREITIGAYKELAAINIQLEKLSQWAAHQMQKEFTEEVKTNPEAAAKKLVNMMAGRSPYDDGQGNDHDEHPHERPKADQLVQTPDGVIRFDQIPGYKDDPSWRPSPDWIDANCMCAKHQEQRKNAYGIDPFRDDNPPGTGMYL